MNANDYRTYHYSTTEARTTTKWFTVYEIVKMLESDNDFDCSEGKLIPYFEHLLKGQHPIPGIYIKQDWNGCHILIGQKSHDIVYSMYYHFTQSNGNRRNSVLATVFEISPHQEDLIKIYERGGFL